MITTINKNQSIIGNDILTKLNSIKIEHPENTFAITPASLISLKAINNNQNLFNGIGIDWGCGTGCLTIAMAKINNVKKIYGLDISPKNIEVSKINSENNNISNKTSFYISDSYNPISIKENEIINNLKGNIDFIFSNPPSSRGDDNFTFRRNILNEGYEYLKSNGYLFLQISVQYGNKRINDLVINKNKYSYEGVIASTPVVEFDLARSDLMLCLLEYVDEEKRGGYNYEFILPEDNSKTISAVEALNYYKVNKKSPLSKWQIHLFKKL